MSEYTAQKRRRHDRRGENELRTFHSIRLCVLTASLRLPTKALCNQALTVYHLGCFGETPNCKGGPKQKIAPRGSLPLGADYSEGRTDMALPAPPSPLARPKAAPKPLTKIATRRQDLRDSLWPGEADKLWHRTTEDGFSTVPRTLPLVMTLIDELKDKGRDISRVYFDLWCRQMDDSFVEVNDEESFAYSSGFTTSGRNVRSWRERIEVLRELGFINVQPNGSRKYGYILLNHPHRVVLSLRAQDKIGAPWWGAFSKRATEIGAALPTL